MSDTEKQPNVGDPVEVKDRFTGKVTKGRVRSITPARQFPYAVRFRSGNLSFFSGDELRVIDG